MRLNGQRLKGHKRPMRVAPIPFALAGTEVFDSVARKLFRRSRAIRPDQPAAAAPTPKQPYRTPPAHKKVWEVDAETKSWGHPEGEVKVKTRVTGPKQSGK